MMNWLFMCILLLSTPCLNAMTKAEAERRLQALYKHEASKSCPSSDIGEHLPVLYNLAQQCESVVEIGLRDMLSSWSFLHGLAKNSRNVRSYLGIDLHSPPKDTLDLAQRLCNATGILFQFWETNDLDIDIDPVDMLFIDSYHTYCHLTYELEKFSPKIRKFIAMHDTSPPWGMQDEGYSGDYSEYPPEIDQKKRGLWPAVEDFLIRHPEWKLRERRLNSYGLTILERR